MSTVVTAKNGTLKLPTVVNNNGSDVSDERPEHREPTELMFNAYYVRSNNTVRLTPKN